MKVLYDHQIFASQKYGGISRYFYELTKELNNTKDIEINISLLLSNNYYLSDKQYTKHYELLPTWNFKGKRRFFNLFNELHTVNKLKKQNFDIFHPTYYDPYFLKHLNNKPFVLTVYDMIHEKFSEMFSAKDKTTEQKKLLVEKATKIIAISQSTKKDLIEIFGINEAKIEVVYLGNSMVPKTDIKLGVDIPKRYLLFVGGRSAYKNFDRFINSISYILKKDPELFVLCAGGGKFNSRENQLFLDLGISNQVLQYNLDDDSLAYLYKNALAFIFPSLYEGFGIPILESFACGCPLLCSDVSSLPEIAGNAACYFDPHSEDSIKNSVIKVLEDSSFREALIDKGFEQLKKFSWEQTVMETKKIYESILK
jgi:glycosyltransferase involved in cell wall biosynthesis